MRRRWTGLVVGLLVASLALPAVAASAVGERLSLFGGPVPASGEPFHIAHGFRYFPGGEGDDFPGRWDFVLFVDGVEVADDGRSVTDNGDGTLSANSLYNFEDGMTGPVLFEGYWYQSCAASTSECDPGDPPGSLTLDLYLPRDVTFGP